MVAQSVACSDIPHNGRLQRAESGERSRHKRCPAWPRPGQRRRLGFRLKIRVLSRRAYGLRDEEYLGLKILTCMLPTL